MINRKTAVFLCLTLVTTAGVASACIPTPASTEPPSEEPTLQDPSPDEAPEPPTDDTVWRYCDRAWVSKISLSDAEIGWALVDCIQDVGIRTMTTEYLYRLVDDQWQFVDVPPEGLPGGPGAYSCLWDISAVGPEEMWAVGMTHGNYGCQDGNWLVHYQDGNWDAFELEEEIAELDDDFFSEHYEGLLAIDMLDADNGWVAGYGLIYRFNHGQWSLDLALPSETAGTFSYPSSDEDAFRAISMASVDSGWAGGIGPLFRYQQGAWTRWEDPLFDSATVQDIDAIHPDEAWAVGYREILSSDNTLYSVPLVWHFVDGHWQETSQPIEEGGLSAVGMVSLDEGWAVGWSDSSDILLHYLNDKWQVVSPPSSRGLSSVAAAAPEQVWIGGADGLYQYVSPADWYHDDLGVSTFSTGVLEIDIAYVGSFYREYFGYTRQAENIRHFVLVIPKNVVFAHQVPARDVFHSIRFQTNPDDPLLKEGSEELSWVLDYLYEAPEGYFWQEFVPGEYYVAVALIAAPIGWQEIGESDGGSPYSGNPAGGASTGYREIVIGPDQTYSDIWNMDDGDGWACPWLYVYDGSHFVRTTEILRDHRGRENERTEVSHIGPVRNVDGAIILRVAEEREEITFIDQLYLMIDGVRVFAESDPQATVKVARRDQDYLIITNGVSYEFIFRVPASVAGTELVDVSIVASGFYVPLE
jgi:hypothetical protein